MGSYPPEGQMNFAIQWFKSWSEFQKDDFVSVLAQRIQADQAGSGDLTELVNGMQALGKPPSLFACQVKLFTEWWSAWASPEREKMLDLFKEADPQFYNTVESEMKGTRKKLDEDFMHVPNSEEDSEAKEGTESVKPEIPVFNVTKVVIDGGSGARVNFNGDCEDKEEDSECAAEANGNGEAGVTVTVTSSENDSEEPVATEI